MNDNEYLSKGPRVWSVDHWRNWYGVGFQVVALSAVLAVAAAGLLPEPHYSSAAAVSSQSIVRHDQPKLVAKVAAPVAYHAAPVAYHAAPVAYHAAPAQLAYHGAPAPIAYHAAPAQQEEYVSSIYLFKWRVGFTVHII